MSKTAHELTRKEMKGPDRFQAAAADVVAWLGARQKAIGIVVVSLIGVLAVAIGIFSFLDARAKSAGHELYKVVVLTGGEVSTTPSDNPAIPTFSTDEEKQRAVIAAAQSVRKNYGGTRAAATAALLEGNAHLSLRDWDKAIAAFKGHLDSAPADDVMRFASNAGLARAEEARGDLAAAAKALEEASKSPIYKERGALERARVLAKAGKKDEAKQILETLLKDSPFQNEAREQLTQLGG